MTRYRPIPSTLGVYLAGDDGHVYREQRVRANGSLIPRYRLAETLYGSTANSKDRGEYLRVHTCVNGVSVDRPVHRLVAEAWLPDFHPLLEVHHVNRDNRDNRPGNLACLTRAEHEREHGVDVPGYDIANARYDFELHSSDPVPTPYSPERARAQRRAQDKWRKSPNRGSGIMQAIRRAEACERSIERYNRKQAGGDARMRAPRAGKDGRDEG